MKAVDPKVVMGALATLNASALAVLACLRVLSFFVFFLSFFYSFFFFFFFFFFFLFFFFSVFIWSLFLCWSLLFLSLFLLGQNCSWLGSWNGYWGSNGRGFLFLLTKWEPVSSFFLYSLFFILFPFSLSFHHLLFIFFFFIIFHFSFLIRQQYYSSHQF